MRTCSFKESGSGMDVKGPGSDKMKNYAVRGPAVSDRLGSGMCIIGSLPTNQKS